MTVFYGIVCKWFTTGKTWHPAVSFWVWLLHSMPSYSVVGTTGVWLYLFKLALFLRICSNSKHLVGKKKKYLFEKHYHSFSISEKEHALIIFDIRSFVKINEFDRMYAFLKSISIPKENTPLLVSLLSALQEKLLHKTYTDLFTNVVHSPLAVMQSYN